MADKNHMRVVCLVCKTPLHEDNLVDAERIVEDNLYCAGGVLLAGSVLLVGSIRLSCDCEHRFDREEVTRDEPHTLVAGVDAVFDESAKCTHFEIAERLPG